LRREGYILVLSLAINYRFSYDKMLSLTGNTAPYMLYAYARCDSPPPGIEKSRVGGSP